MIRCYSIELYKLLPILFTVFSIGYSSTVFSSTVTGSMAVTATVLGICTVTPSALAFSNYSLSSNTDNTTTIVVTCTSGTSYNVGLNAGTGTGANTSVRKLTSLSSDTLNYALYTDSGRTTNWGNNTSGEVTGTASLTPDTLTVYGRIPSGQAAAAGAYTDTVTVTVTY